MQARRAQPYPPRILFFWLWNSSSVSTPLFRSSARRSSSPVVEADAGGMVAWAGAAGPRPPPRYMRSLLSSPWWEIVLWTYSGLRMSPNT